MNTHLYSTFYTRNAAQSVYNAKKYYNKHKAIITIINVTYN